MQGYTLTPGITVQQYDTAMCCQAQSSGLHVNTDAWWMKLKHFYQEHVKVNVYNVQTLTE